mgnify:FL=1
MLNAPLCTNLIERMLARWLVDRLVLLVDGEAVRELGAIVGKNGVHRMREVGEETFKEFFRSPGIPVLMDLHVDVASGPIDRDEGVAFTSLEGRQMWMKPTVACSKMPTAGLSGFGLWFRPCRFRQRWIALRDSLQLTQRRITSTISSSGNCSRVRSSQTSASSISERLVVSFFGVCERSLTVVRVRHRRIVVWLTPSSLASSAIFFLLR